MLENGYFRQMLLSRGKGNDLIPSSKDFFFLLNKDVLQQMNYFFFKRCTTSWYILGNICGTLALNNREAIARTYSVVANNLIQEAVSSGL